MLYDASSLILSLNPSPRSSVSTKVICIMCLSNCFIYLYYNRKKSFSLSESSAISPVTSHDASSLIPSLNPSPRSSVSTKATGSQRTLPITPAHDKMRELMNHGKRSPGNTRIYLILIYRTLCCKSISGHIHLS